MCIHPVNHTLTVGQCVGNSCHPHTTLRLPLARSLPNHVFSVPVCSDVHIAGIYTADCPLPSCLIYAVWYLLDTLTIVSFLYFTTLSTFLDTLDGAAPLQSRRSVVVPLALTGLLSAFLLIFVDTWNEFLAALVMLSGSS
jgi:ABC-type glycerol-3-phosphate transport system permease component